MSSVLEIKNLRTSFPTKHGKIFAADQVSFSIPRGEMMALVGESGSGKSVTAMSVLRLIQKPGQIESGEVLFHQKDGKVLSLLDLPENQIRAVRGNKIAMIFQEPMTSLNPVFTIGDQIAEVFILHQKSSRKEAREKTIEVLKQVGIPNPERRIDQYPHEMSGGMRQRVMIAMGLSCRPDLLIADEPTTALDVTIQAQIMELIGQLISDLNMSCLLITHDLGVVAGYAKRVAVMYAGQVIEEATTTDLFDHPKHPYTKGLLESIPSHKKSEGVKLHAIPGMVPHLAKLPHGCRFQDRCERATPDCRMNEINMEMSEDQRYRCVHPYA